MADHPDLDRDQLRALAVLDEPNRRRLNGFVVARGEPVTRDQASVGLRLDRSLAAYHLDRLVDEGLLQASFARPDGRGGPGAGRPAKRYERADREFAVSVPPRDYRLVAEVLAHAAETDATGAVRAAVEQAAVAIGREIAPTSAPGEDDLRGRLAALGFEPYHDGVAIRLRNCPFRRLARAHTELICSMNLALLSGLAAALDAPARPRLEPDPDGCCVVFDLR